MRKHLRRAKHVYTWHQFTVLIPLHLKPASAVAASFPHIQLQRPAANRRGKHVTRAPNPRPRPAAEPTSCHLSSRWSLTHTRGATSSGTLPPRYKTLWTPHTVEFLLSWQKQWHGLSWGANNSGICSLLVPLQGLSATNGWRCLPFNTSATHWSRGFCS